MSDEKNEAFRVVDKRRFSGEGEAKDPTAKDTVEEKTKPMERSVEQRATEPRSDEAITYSSFVFSIGMQGLVMMGEGGLQGAGEPPIEINLAAARETIDLLSLLKEKTKGNLTPDEEKLTEEILTSLRMTYVRKTSAK